ncbi:hypothetical protein J1N35_002415 [Gossypium stocksii]|uniref:Reverse transcriptase domain-containing protein n=1 Tax=Gossypium stocksii TaxID=47602 RepID=A0A9D3WJJ3_9ROSI|nr:hypothetical protein J1N35_002415 [Gossypium stocksii]
MMECVTTARATVLVNGSATNKFGMGMGLPQCDPLSPFLFILVMEVLHLMLDRAKELGLIGGIQEVLSDRSFSRLQFADDTILFLRVEKKFVKNMKYLLRCFEIFSGLSINFKKSCLIGFGMEEELLYRLPALCKCKIGTLPFDYLGIPLGADLKRISTWNSIV